MLDNGEIIAYKYHQSHEYNTANTSGSTQNVATWYSFRGRRDHRTDARPGELSAGPWRRALDDAGYCGRCLQLKSKRDEGLLLVEPSGYLYFARQGPLHRDRGVAYKPALRRLTARHRVWFAEPLPKSANSGERCMALDADRSLPNRNVRRMLVSSFSSVVFRSSKIAGGKPGGGVHV